MSLHRRLCLRSNFNEKNNNNKDKIQFFQFQFHSNRESLLDIFCLFVFISNARKLERLKHSKYVLYEHAIIFFKKGCLFLLIFCFVFVFIFQNFVSFFSRSFLQNELQQTNEKMKNFAILFFFCYRQSSSSIYDDFFSVKKIE